MTSALLELLSQLKRKNIENVKNKEIIRKKKKKITTQKRGKRRKKT